MRNSYWFWFSIIMLIAFSYDAVKNFNYTRIELAKANKCECGTANEQSKQETTLH